jgi:surfeit locus 1 family protein
MKSSVLIRALPWVIFILLFSLLISLGCWQLRRAAEKEILVAQYESRAVNKPLALSALENFDSWSAAEKEQQLFSKIELRGIFDAQHPIVLLNKIHEHRLGFHILMPFFAEGADKPILVNLGWLPHPSAGQSKKTVSHYQELPIIPAMKGTHTITVYLSEPHAGWTVGPPIAGEISWPLPMTYLDWNTFEAAYHHSVAHYVGLLSEEEKIGFIRTWYPVTILPARHVAYAVQWFALALTLMLIVVFLQIRARRKGRDLS